MNYSNWEAMDEGEAFAVCSTTELQAMGLVTDAALEELLAPWTDESEWAQAA